MRVTCGGDGLATVVCWNHVVDRLEALDHLLQQDDESDPEDTVDGGRGPPLPITVVWMNKLEGQERRHQRTTSGEQGRRSGAQRRVVTNDVIIANDVIHCEPAETSSSDSINNRDKSHADSPTSTESGRGGKELSDDPSCYSSPQNSDFDSAGCEEFPVFSLRLSEEFLTTPSPPIEQQHPSLNQGQWPTTTGAASLNNCCGCKMRSVRAPVSGPSPSEVWCQSYATAPHQRSPAASYNLTTLSVQEVEEAFTTIFAAMKYRNTTTALY